MICLNGGFANASLKPHYEGVNSWLTENCHPFKVHLNVLEKLRGLFPICLNFHAKYRERGKLLHFKTLNLFSWEISLNFYRCFNLRPGLH